jgi:hypothetical protein
VSYAQASEDLGVHPTLFRNWVKQLAVNVDSDGNPPYSSVAHAFCPMPNRLGIGSTASRELYMRWHHGHELFLRNLPWESARERVFSGNVSSRRLLPVLAPRKVAHSGRLTFGFRYMRGDGIH